MFRHHTLIFISVMNCLLSPVAAHANDSDQYLPVSDTKHCQPSPQNTAASTITKIIDHQTLRLKNNQIIRLSGIHVPAIKAPKSEFLTIPRQTNFKRIQKFLQQIALGQEVFYDKTGLTNRYGYLRTPLFLKTQNKSLQYLLIKNGFALFYSLQSKNPCLLLWRSAEQEAKAALIGMWKYPNTIIKEAKPVKKLNWHTQKFQLISGRVHAIGRSRKLIYLNFDKNWRKDFTITIEKKKLTTFEKSGLDIHQLAGKRIQVRGWLEWHNGPTMSLEQSDNLEILQP